MGETESLTFLGALPASRLLFPAVGEHWRWAWELCRAKPAYLCERRNEAGDADQTSVSKQPGHLSNPADIFFPVSGGESKVFVKAMTDVVPIEGVARDGVGDEVLFQSKTYRCFPSTGETCSEQARPDRASSLIVSDDKTELNPECDLILIFT